MAQRTLSVLYVEDDPLQQRLVEHALRSVPEFACTVTFAASEDAAVAAFRKAPADVVLVDYQLSEGNGLAVVRRVREVDRVVPIIAISGVAPEEIAESLVLSGADDYLDKKNLDSKALGRSLRAALLRSDGVRKRLLPMTHAGTPLADELKDLARLLNAVGPESLLAALDRCEQAARSVGVVGPRLMDALNAAQLEAGRSSTLGIEAVRKLLRPFILDLMERLYTSPPDGN